MHVRVRLTASVTAALLVLSGRARRSNSGVVATPSRWACLDLSSSRCETSNQTCPLVPYFS
jgi:hypothetical protein